jgi:asparagine synthase (glutamine-hydrolysing)
MNVGFTVFARHAEAEFRVRDHGQQDRPPLVTQAAAAGVRAVRAVRAVLMGRLYYRAELRVGLDLAVIEHDNRVSNHEEESDAALALAVYLRRGLEGLEHLEGDFALLIFDEGARRLVAMRDPMGGYPIFYTARGNDGVAAGTHMGPLLDAQATRTLNQEYLADYLVSPGLPLEETPVARTAYQGVQRVLPGCIAVFDLSCGKVEQRRYWDWLQRRVDPGTDNVAELGEQFLDRLRAAVSERLRGGTAAHVSGGMDSTAVALIARDCLQGREPLHALSLVYDRLPYLARERPYVESALGQRGLAPHRINGDDILDFGCCDTAPAHDEPCPGLMRLGVADQALTDAAAGAGVATIMTGLGADDIFGPLPFHLTELLRGGRLWAAWSEASRWARAWNCNVWDLLGPYGLNNLLPAWTRMGVGNWWRGGYARWGRNTEWTVAPWIRPDFARRMGLRERSLANLRRSYYACQPVRLSMALSSIGMYQDTFSRMHLAAPHGIVLTHPFLDPRVFSLGLGALTRVRPEPGAQKPVLAAAMRGILPECILNRPSKGNFNEAYYMGLSRNLPRLEALVEQAPVDDLGFLDKTSLLDCLQRAALGNAGDAGALMHLTGTLSLLLWLTQERHGPSIAARSIGQQERVEAA